MQIYWTKIKEIVEETPEIKTYYLELPEGFTWDEGAHTHFALEGFNAGDQRNRELIRHMSICTIPNENSIGITTRIREECSIFKSTLRGLDIGHQVALFKTHSNVPLRREGKNIYLLSSGVGLATFRPLVINYLANGDNINHIHSLNIDTKRQFLFTEIFETNDDKKFTSQFVDSREDYYAEVHKLAADKDGLFYIVGSDEFLEQNIAILRDHGIKPAQFTLDKREQQRAELLAF